MIWGDYTTVFKHTIMKTINAPFQGRLVEGFHLEDAVVKCSSSSHRVECGLHQYWLVAIFMPHMIVFCSSYRSIHYV